jgi:hypothetical protein
MFRKIYCASSVSPAKKVPLSEFHHCVDAETDRAKGKNPGKQLRTSERARREQDHRAESRFR